MIRSDNGSSVTIIRSNATDMHVVNITNQTNVTLEGFEIRDAHGTTQNVAGIYINNASKCNISNDIVTNIYSNYDAYGIWLERATNNEFYDCTISDLTAGIITTYGVYMVDWSDENLFSGGKIFRGEGPIIDYGVYMESCMWNSILDSEIIDNKHGVWVNNSDNNTIERNKIINNTVDTGVYVTAGSDDNEIHENCFIDNLPQAIDNGANNDWDGNFWSDYPQAGVYSILGSANSKDNHTLRQCPGIVGPVAVPELTPIGLIALIGVLSVIAAISISISINIRKKMR